VLSEDISAQLTEFQAGYLLASYRLEREVGAGGMAVVFRARDERLGRPVALKILSPAQASDSEFRRRFIAESQAAAAVDDPHIIPVYEAGEADGVLFIAMRYVGGGDLRHMLKREGALPPDRAADYVSQVASALDAAHAAGLIHRDVKPGNILVDTRAGRPDHVYLSDFGIVRRTASERLTRVGANVGTPDYMAPEQIAGQDVDGRADQYSLACVTVQLLTGALPFKRDTLPALIYAHLAAPPPSLVSRRQDLPAAVDAVMAKAMAKTPDERYGSCGDFADALQEALGLASYQRRSSAAAPPYPPPPGTDETPEAVVADHPDATAGQDPGLTPRTVTTAPAEGPEAALAGAQSAADPETTGPASEPGGLTAAASVTAGTSDVPAPGSAPADPQHSVSLPSEITPPASATPSRRPRWPHRRNRAKRQSSAVASVPDAASPAGSQLAEELGATAWPDEQAGEAGASEAATDHGADVRDLPTSGQSRSAEADGAAAPPAATASEGLPAAAAVAEDQRPGDPGTIVPSDEPGLTAATGTDVLAPVRADGHSGTTSPAGPVVAGGEVPGVAATTPAGPVVAGGEVPGVAATTPAGPVVAGGEVPGVAATTPAGPVVAGGDVPAVSATTPASRQLAGDLGTTPRSGESADQLPWLVGAGSGGDGTGPAQRAPRHRGPVAAWIRRYRLPVFALACAVVAAAATLPFITPNHPTSSRPGPSASPSISARPATALGFGWVSLGNLSQTPSSADVYLYSSGSSSPQFVQHGVTYGTILPYHAVNAGDYTVQVRAAGASASSSPVWSVSFIVHAGGAYTVAPIRATAQRGQLKVIDNDLTAPKGKSLVRVIQADVSQGQVTFHCSCAAGAPGNITTDAAPDTVSPQVPIPVGTWTMSATGPSAKTSLPVTLTDGAVHNEIVISKPGGGLEIINLVQAPPSYKRVVVPLNGSSAPITSVAFSPSGATLAIGTTPLCLWDIAAARCTSGLAGVNAYSLAFSRDGKTLAVTDGISSSRTYLWNIAASSQTAPLTGPALGGAYSVAFTSDGRTLAVGYDNGDTYLWDVATRKPVFPLTDPGGKGVNSVAFSPDGKILAVGDNKGPTYLWDVATRTPIRTLPDPGGTGVTSVAFTHDGKILAAGDANGHTYLWDVATGKPIFALPDPDTKGVASVACSPDNTTMAAADNNGSIYIWNVDNGKLLAVLADPNKEIINSVSFSPDGQVLAASDNNGGVFLWYKS
jgi:serine/threonine-protein kinase